MKSGSELRSDDHQIEEVVERWTKINVQDRAPKVA